MGDSPPLDIFYLPHSLLGTSISAILLAYVTVAGEYLPYKLTPDPSWTLDSFHMISKVLNISGFLAHTTVGKSSFMNSLFMIPKMPLTSVVIPTHITLAILPDEYLPYSLQGTPQLQ